MCGIAASMVGKRLMYIDLTADNGPDSMARSMLEQSLWRRRPRELAEPHFLLE